MSWRVHAQDVSCLFKTLLNAACKVVNNACTSLRVIGGPRWIGTHCFTIITITMSFKFQNRLENLTPVWKCVETNFLFLSCLNNLGRLCFVIYLHTENLLLHRPLFRYILLGIWIYQLLLTNNLKREENKIHRKGLRDRYFVSTIVKQPIAYVCAKVSKIGNISRGWPEGSFFNSYNTEV